MKKTIYTMTALAAVILAAAGCAKQEAGTQGPASLMSIEPEVEGTKATLITTTTGLQGQGFGVSIYNGTTPYKDKVEMVYSGSAWTHPSDATDWKWPSNTVYTFYAWSPADLAVGSVTSTGVPAFTYTGIADQTDIMLGCYSGTGNNGAAPVKFSHALASVQFKTGTMTGLGNITKIELSGVATSGTCTPTTFAWSGISSSTTTLTQSSLTVATTTSGTVIGTPFLTLPQSAALTVTLTDANSKTVTATIATPSLSVGHTAIYTINYDGQTASFTVSIENWATGQSGNVTVEEEVEELWVDLGLPSGLKWAKCNLGATKPEEYGDFFAWGETSGHKLNSAKTGFEDGHIFDWTTAPFNNGSEEFNETYFNQHKSEWITGDGILKPEYDAATVICGDGWRMPTLAEVNELIEKTSCEWISNYNNTGISGTLYKNRSDNTKSIFIPAAGVVWNVELYYERVMGYCWSSSLDTEFTDNSFILNTPTNPKHQDYCGSSTRESGMHIRPVFDGNE